MDCFCIACFLIFTWVRLATSPIIWTIHTQRIFTSPSLGLKTDWYHTVKILSKNQIPTQSFSHLNSFWAADGEPGKLGLLEMLTVYHPGHSYFLQLPPQYPLGHAPSAPSPTFSRSERSPAERNSPISWCSLLCISVWVCCSWDCARNRSFFKHDKRNCCQTVQVLSHLTRVQYCSKRALICING